jgi:hypothetical protein
MSSLNSTAPLAPRLHVTVGTALTALGAVLAIAATIVTLALTGANHTTAASPPTASQAASSPTTHVRYLGPRQLKATPDPQSGATAGAGNAAPRYTCLGAAQTRQGCFR